MNRVMINVLHLGMAATFAASLSACDRNADAGTSNAAAAFSSGAANTVASAAKYAKVISVDPVRETDGPRQVCRDETVTHTAPPKDQHRIVGTAIGAVAGGLLGNQVGGGKGKTLATVAGAV
ncbi:MAG: glycine zipper 2TM domain-containing protein, partial [Rhodanobacter sp.]